MAADGSVPPVNFNKRFDKPPKQNQERRRKQSDTADEDEFRQEHEKPRPVDPENPPSIDLTA